MSSKDDKIRLKYILSLLDKNYDKALDIGSADGFITKHLPAKIISAIEIDENLRSKLPATIIPVKDPVGTYDLVICTSVLYEEHDHRSVYKTILQSSCKHILIEGEKDLLINYDFGNEVKSIEFEVDSKIHKVSLYEILNF